MQFLCSSYSECGKLKNGSLQEVFFKMMILGMFTKEAYVSFILDTDNN